MSAMRVAHLDLMFKPTVKKKNLLIWCSNLIINKLTRRHSGCPCNKSSVLSAQTRCLLSVEIYCFESDVLASCWHFYWGQLCKEAIEETPYIYSEEEKQKRDVDWESERMKSRQDRTGGGSKVGHISLAHVTVAFLIRRASWEICPIKKKSNVKQACGLFSTHVRTRCRLFLYMPLLVRQGSLLFASVAAAFTTRLICLHNRVRSCSQGARSHSLHLTMPCSLHPTPLV